MKLRLLLLFLFPLAANAQDWALFPYGQRSFYYTTDSLEIYEIRQDSTQIIGDTSHLFFNKKAPSIDLQECYNELLEIDGYDKGINYVAELKQKGNTIFYFNNNYSSFPFYIILNASIGASWDIYNDYPLSSWDHITMTYDSIGTEVIISTIDSVKYFSLHVDGGAPGEYSIDKVKFRLSKTYGLIEYVILDNILLASNCATCYRTNNLAGYKTPEDSAGIFIPSWSDYFKYQPGDILKWCYYGATTTYYVDTIISVEKFEDSIKITYNHLGFILEKIYYKEALQYCLESPNNTIIYSPPFPYWSDFLDIGGIAYNLGLIDNLTLDSISFPGKVLQSRHISCDYYQDVNDCIVAGPHKFGSQYDFNSYLGLTGYSECNADFECFGYYLAGAILSGQSWGDVSPVNIVNAPHQNTSLNFSPNPVTKEISINTLLEGNYNYHIYSINGQTVGSGILIDYSINIESLNSGVFILELENEKETLMGRFIKL